jgi:hypothetical protein
MQVRERPRHHRRRRTAIGVAALLSVLAGLTAAACSDTRGSGGSAQPVRSAPATPSPRPSGSAAPSPTPSPAPDADTIIRSGHLYSYASGAAGSVLTVWQTCTDDEPSVCHAAWQVQAATGTHRGLLPGDSPSAYAAGDAFVVKAWNSKGVLVTAQGAVRQLVDGKPGEVTPDDALVPGRHGLYVADPRTATLWPLPRPAGAGGFGSVVVAPDATTWASMSVGGEVWLAWTSGGTWQHHVMPADEPHDDLPAYVAVAGDHVAGVSGYDGATILPVADLAVTADGGKTWRDLHQRDLPFTYVDAMAATAGGTLYVVTEDGHGGRGFFRTTDRTWTRFAELPNPHHLEVLEPAGDHVLAQGGSYEDPALFLLDDRGHSTPVPLAR